MSKKLFYPGLHFAPPRLLDFDGTAKGVIGLTGNNAMLPNAAFPDTLSFGILAVGQNATVNFKGTLSNEINVNGNNHTTDASNFIAGNDAIINFDGIAIAKNETNGSHNIVNAETVNALYGAGNQGGQVRVKGKALVSAIANGHDSVATANLFAVDNTRNNQFAFTGNATVNAKAVGNGVVANANGITTSNQANVAIDNSVININAQASGPNSTAQSNGILIDSAINIAGSATAISNSTFNVSARGDSISTAIGINNNEAGAAVALLNSTFSMKATRGYALAKALLTTRSLNLAQVNSEFLCNGVNCPV